MCKATYHSLNYGEIMAAEGVCSSISPLTDIRQDIPENFYLIETADITYDMAVIYRKENEKEPRYP
ncbi:MAG: hypothetical protein V8S58_02700 [Lachnospiraceae bacterium]